MSRHTKYRRKCNKNPAEETAGNSKIVIFNYYLAMGCGTVPEQQEPKANKCGIVPV